MDSKKPKGSDIPDDSGLSDELRLKQEMDELARVFQEELDKAKAEEALRATELEKEHEILIQELDDDITYDAEEPEDIPEDELCECCGQKRRGTKNNPDSPYCRDCERGLRRYPFDFLNIVLVIILLGFSLYACLNFAQRIKIYTSAAKADRFVSQKKLYSAETEYSNTVKLLNEESINAELVYQRIVSTLWSSGDVDGIYSYEEKFKSFELKLPHFKKAKEVFDRYESWRITEYRCEELLSEYDSENLDVSTLPYDEIIAKLEAVKSESVADYYAQFDEMAVGADSAPSFSIKATAFNPAVVELCKFYVANATGQELDTQLKYLNACKSLEPDIPWLYREAVASIYLSNGIDMTEICNQWNSINVENCLANAALITQMRLKGNYKDAISFAEGLVPILSDYDQGSVGFLPEIFRQQAISYIMTGEYEKAYNAAGSVCALCEHYGYRLFNSDKALYTLAVCSVLVGNTDEYGEVEKTLGNYQLEMPDEVVALKDGNLDVKTIFTQGDCDV